MFNSMQTVFIPAKEADRIIRISGKAEKHTLRIEVSDAILLLLTSIEHKKAVVSRTLLQKELFLLYEIVLKKFGLSNGAQEDAGYFAYRYGPYSFEVNVALSTLIFSGRIRVDNYYLMEEESKNRKDIFNRKFLTYFETKEPFDNVAEKYDEFLTSREVTVHRLQREIANKKRSWDQSTYRGIRALIEDMEIYDQFFSERELKDVYPNIFYGRITEDYIPRRR